MGTIVLLACFLLAASANPIANSDNNSFEDASDTHPGDVSSTDDDSHSSHPDNTNNNTGEKETPIDYLRHSTEDNGSDDTEEQDISHQNSADSDNADNNTGDEHSSSVDNDSTTSTKVFSEDNTSNHDDDAATSVNSSDSTGSTEPSTGGNTINRTEDTTTSSDTSVSTTSTKTETSTQESSDTVPTPPDADPKDCKNATEKNHTYLLCTYSCQGDEMFTAPDNSTCYLHPGNMTAEVEIAEDYVRTEHNPTGICYRGECVRSLADATAATTESSTADTPKQQSNDTVTVPPDADPKDCKNATEKNHTYVLCTYSCQGDEMFAAPDHSPCYLYPTNLASGILLTEKYEHREHNANETGVCRGGECVPRSTGAPMAPTESSPGTITTTTAETGSETQSTINDQPPGMSAKPNEVSESLPQPSQPQDTPMETGGSPEKPLTNGGSSEVEEASSPVKNSAEAIPEPARPQETPAEIVGRPERPSPNETLVDAGETSSAVPDGPVALPGALPAMT